jgi:hypothetical protein
MQITEISALRDTRIGVYLAIGVYGKQALRGKDLTQYFEWMKVNGWKRLKSKKQSGLYIGGK